MKGKQFGILIKIYIGPYYKIHTNFLSRKNLASEINIKIPKI